MKLSMQELSLVYHVKIESEGGNRSNSIVQQTKQQQIYYS